MKKLTALLMGCLMMTAAFTSCGKKDDDESNSKENPVKGEWVYADDGSGMDLILNFRDDDVAVSADMSSMMCFKDGSFVLQGQDLGKEMVDFDGKNLVVALGDNELMDLERTEGEGDSFDGKYDIVGGSLAEELNKKMEGASFVIDGDKFMLTLDPACEYEVDDSTLTLKNPPEGLLTEGEDDESEVEFTVEDDTLTLKNEDGDEKVLTRAE